jgi:hypothetical protein
VFRAPSDVKGLMSISGGYSDTYISQNWTEVFCWICSFSVECKQDLLTLISISEQNSGGTQSINNAQYLVEENLGGSRVEDWAWYGRMV